MCQKWKSMTDWMTDWTTCSTGKADKPLDTDTTYLWAGASAEGQERTHPEKTFGLLCHTRCHENPTLEKFMLRYWWIDSLHAGFLATSGLKGKCMEMCHCTRIKLDVFSTGKTPWQLDTLLTSFIFWHANFAFFRSSYRASPRTWTVWMQLPHRHQAWLQVARADGLCLFTSAQILRSWGLVLELSEQRQAVGVFKS